MKAAVLFEDNGRASTGQQVIMSPAHELVSSLQPLTNETNLLPEEMMNSSLYEEPVDPAKWFGIRKDATALGYSKVCACVYVSLAAGMAPV